MQNVILLLRVLLPYTTKFNKFSPLFIKLRLGAKYLKENKQILDSTVSK